MKAGARPGRGPLEPKVHGNPRSRNKRPSKTISNMMGARAMWKGVLRLGSEHMPVKLYPAVQDRTVHFHILEKESETRVRQQMIAPETEEEQPDQKVQKGYEIEPGTFVVVKPDELQKVEPPASRDIVPLAFVPAETINPQWYERPYYLVPEQISDSYFALLDALEDTKKAGIAQWVMRKRQYYGALCPMQQSLVLIAMRNSEEILSTRDLPAPGKPPDSRELPLAEQLIKALEGEFNPEEFHDEYRERVQTFLDQKAKGRAPKLKAVRQKKPPESVLEALTASLKAMKKKGKAVA